MWFCPLLPIPTTISWLWHKPISFMALNRCISHQWFCLEGGLILLPLNFILWTCTFPMQCLFPFTSLVSVSTITHRAMLNLLLCKTIIISYMGGCSCFPSITGNLALPKCFFLFSHIYFSLICCSVWFVGSAQLFSCQHDILSRLMASSRH